MFHVKHPAAATTSATRRPGADASRRALETRPSPQSSSGFAIASAATTPARQHASVLIGRTVSGSPRSRPRCAQAAAGFSATSHCRADRRPYNGAASDSHHLLESQRRQTPAPVRAFSEASPTGTTPTIGTTPRRGGVFHVKLPRTSTQRNGHQFTPPACRPHGDQARRSVRGWVALATPAAHSSRPPVAPRGQFERSPDVSPTPVTLPPIGETPAGAGRST